jgi:hypothetical protein
MVKAILISASLLVAAPVATSSMTDVHHAGIGYQGLAAAGSDLLCGIRSDDSLDCWGRDAISVADHPDGPFIGVSAARRAACAIRADGTLQCWGRWYSDVAHDSQVVAPEGMYGKVDLAEEQGCAIGIDGRVTCFGYFDQSGSRVGVVPIDGAFADVAAIHDDFGGCGIRTDGTVACWGDDTWGQASPPEGRFTDIAAGRMTVCAIGIDSHISCWGRGLYGAADPPAGHYSALAIGGDTGCAISTIDESLDCWGADLGRPPDVPAAALAIGDNIAGLIGTNGVVHTWGETRLWRIWGGWDVVEQRYGFGAFRIVNTAPRTVTVGEPVDFAFATTEIQPEPRFRIAAGALPPGLTLDREGRLGGTPAQAGRYGPVTVVADNGHSPMTSVTFELEVLAAAG